MSTNRSAKINLPFARSFKIAEAWAKRRYTRHFVSKLTDADGEQQEAQHWTISAFHCGYITKEQARDLGTQTVEIGRMLGDMIENAESFCGGGYAPALRETENSYFAGDSTADASDTEY